VCERVRARVCVCVCLYTYESGGRLLVGKTQVNHSPATLLLVFDYVGGLQITHTHRHTQTQYVRTGAGGACWWARPKSMTVQPCLLLFLTMLAGLRSRCMIPTEAASLINCKRVRARSLWLCGGVSVGVLVCVYETL
jgi:hypothetical protein